MGSDAATLRQIEDVLRTSRTLNAVDPGGPWGELQAIKNHVRAAKHPLLLAQPRRGEQHAADCCCCRLLLLSVLLLMLHVVWLVCMTEQAICLELLRSSLCLQVPCVNMLVFCTLCQSWCQAWMQPIFCQGSTTPLCRRWSW